MLQANGAVLNLDVFYAVFFTSNLIEVKICLFNTLGGVMRRFSKFFALVSVVFIASFVSANLFGIELSMISGLYQTESSKNDGTNAGGDSTISMGGRVGNAMSQNLGWVAGGLLTMKSYTAPEGGKAPDSSTGIQMGGGLQYFFDPFGDRIVPYVLGAAYVLSEKEASSSGNTITETTTSGLYYGANVGLKFKFSASVFMFLESELFESALSGSVKTETKTTVGTTTTTTKNETTKTELYVDTAGAFGTTLVGVGMVF